MPIYLPPDLVRAPTKTLAFTGAANLGAVASPITIWTITGRMLLIYGTAFCTETVVSTAGTGTIALGNTSIVGRFIAAATMGAGTLALGDWWNQAGTPAGVSDDWVASAAGTAAYGPQALSENIIVTVATNAITDGTLVFDCYYMPLTAGASLS